MALTDAQKQSRYDYAKKNLKRIPLGVQKEKYEEIKAASEKSANPSMDISKKPLMSGWNGTQKRTDKLSALSLTPYKNSFQIFFPLTAPSQKATLSKTANVSKA